MILRRIWSVIVPSLSAALFLAGCAGPSRWEANYVGSRSTPLNPDAAVQVRNVPWERVQGTLRGLETQAAASDVHPEDWSEEKKYEVKGTLLRGLQVGDDPSSIQVLGRSSFRTTSAIDPSASDGAAISKFAREIGATRVAWTSTYLGKADTIVQEPVSTWTQFTVWDSRDKKGRPQAREYSEMSTTWVPIRVQADEHAFVAYFLLDLGR